MRGKWNRVGEAAMWAVTLMAIAFMLVTWGAERFFPN